MKKICIIFIFTSLLLPNLLGQKILFQDIYKGGVTIGGFSSGMLGSYSGVIDLQIPTGSTIRKAFLFAYRVGYPPNVPFTVNGFNYLFDTANCIMSVKHALISFSPTKLYYKDITQAVIANNVDTFSVILPGYDTTHLNWGWFLPIIYVEYENSSLPKISTALWVNNKNYMGNESYSFTNLNSINTSFPVGLSLFDDRECNNYTSFGNGTPDGTIVTLNNSNLGAIGGSDSVNFNANCGGAKGHFYYQNNTLYGLDDDTPDSLMNGTDALADISSYLNLGATGFNINLEHGNYPYEPANFVNVHLLFVNAYTSPCDTFTTSLSSDTTICAGDSAQLHASGGIKYQWQPAYGLSCTTCANPTASPDSSVTYTVRIYNNDSCSKVLPVRVKVYQIKPKIETTPATCGDKNGSIHIFGRNVIKYRLGSTSNSTGIFKQLSQGSYPIMLTDSFGCSLQDTVVVGFKNIAFANFGIIPSDSGKAPLKINTYNNSQYTNKYIWAVNGDSLYTSTISYTFEKAGHYTITLIACHNSYPCCDTMSKEIVVTPLSLDSVPNVFTPNGDGINDKFTINLSGVERGKISIFNRWGILLYHTYMQEANAQHNLKLQWNGKTEKSKDCSAGTYYYVIDYIPFEEGEKTIKGNVTLLR